MSVLIRRPVWIVGHIIAVVAVISFINLGFWQLDRADDRDAQNDLIAERHDLRPAELDALLAAGGDPAELEHRPVHLVGTYRPDEEVMLSTRSHAGRPGHHVLTPFETADGPTVIVDRGWVPVEWSDPPVTAAPPPAGEVELTGWIVAPRSAQRSGPPGADQVTFVSDVDLDRLAMQVSGALLPVAVQAAAGGTAPGEDYPVPAQLEPLDPGPHRSYAGQWFMFAGVVGIGYPVLCWRTATGRNNPDDDLSRDA